MRSWQDELARHLAYASDYAWTVDCFTRIGELTGKASWIDHASRTAFEMLDLFSDRDTGAIWTTGSDAEPILVRPVDLLDDATPSAASVASSAMLRLGALTGNQVLIQAAERLLALLVPLGTEHPLAVANALGSMALAGGGTLEVVVAGDRSDLLQCVRRRYEPDVVIAWGERTSSPVWEARPDGAAYVCHQNTCLVPATTVLQLNDRLEAEGGRSMVASNPVGQVRWASTQGGNLEGKVSE